MSYLEKEKFNLIPTDKAYSIHRPKILILYGSLRDRSFSRLLAEEAGRILEYMGAEVKFFPLVLLRMGWQCYLASSTLKSRLTRKAKEDWS